MDKSKTIYHINLLKKLSVALFSFQPKSREPCNRNEWC